MLTVTVTEAPNRVRPGKEKAHGKEESHEEESHKEKGNEEEGCKEGSEEESYQEKSNQEESGQEKGSQEKGDQEEGHKEKGYQEKSYEEESYEKEGRQEGDPPQETLNVIQGPRAPTIVSHLMPSTLRFQWIANSGRALSEPSKKRVFPIGNALFSFAHF